MDILFSGVYKSHAMYMEISFGSGDASLVITCQENDIQIYLKHLKDPKCGLVNHNWINLAWRKAIRNEKATKFYEPSTRALPELINSTKSRQT